MRHNQPLKPLSLTPPHSVLQCGLREAFFSVLSLVFRYSGSVAQW